MSRGAYDSRAPSAASQIICLERLLDEAEQRNGRLCEVVEQWEGKWISEREEVNRLRELLREGILHLEEDGSAGCESVARFLKSKLGNSDEG